MKQPATTEKQSSPFAAFPPPPEGDGRTPFHFSLRSSLGRAGAVVLRHWYVISASWPRAAELIYWPLIQMLTWGLLQVHLSKATDFATNAAGLFVGGVLLWDILVRGQLGFSVAFIEDVWSRNLGNLLMSPLRPSELIFALMVVSLIKLAVAMIPVALLAYVLFGFNLLSLGIAFAAFFAVLILMSWSLGLISMGAILRWGLGAESIAWVLAFALMPLSCVYYPVSTLPPWLQPVAWALPSTHVFEGLRGLILHGEFYGQLLASALALNAFYLTCGMIAFRYFLASARENGSLMHMGE